MLDGLDPLMQLNLIVIRKNRHFLTQDDRTAVDRVCDVMDRRSGSRQSLAAKRLALCAVRVTPGGARGW